MQQAERGRAQVAVGVVGARERGHDGLEEVAAQDGAVQRDGAQERPHLGTRWSEGYGRSEGYGWGWG